MLTLTNAHYCILKNSTGQFYDNFLAYNWLNSYLKLTSLGYTYNNSYSDIDEYCSDFTYSKAKVVVIKASKRKNFSEKTLIEFLKAHGFFKVVSKFDLVYAKLEEDNE
jgi:hypothetical protein